MALISDDKSYYRLLDIGQIINNLSTTIAHISKSTKNLKAKKDSDAKIRLPKEIKNAIIESVALDQMQFRSPNQRGLRHDDRVARENELALRIKRLTRVFNCTPFIHAYDMGSDFLNGENLLRITVDIEKISPKGRDIQLSKREKDAAFKSAWRKIGSMGYLQKRESSPEGRKVSALIRKYTPPSN